VEHGLFKIPYEIKMTSEESLKRVPEYIQPFGHSVVPAEDHPMKVAVSLSHLSDDMKNCKHFKFIFI
jgi:hypothetical protein